jgi:hypothetical protein
MSIDPAKMAVLTSIKRLSLRLVFTFLFFTFHCISFHLSSSNTVITGFNTDIEHEGVVYHVQTEDKGLDSPLILSLVYSGGAILASKRSRYEDLIASGFDEEALAQRLKRQHRLICAAINAGRIEDLKRMGASTEEKAGETVTEPEAPPDIEMPDIEIVDNASDYASLPQSLTQGSSPESVPEELEIVRDLSDYSSGVETPQTEALPPSDVSEEEQPPVEPSAYTVHDSRRQSPLGEPMQPDGLSIKILDEQDFWAGGSFHIRIMVADRTNQQEVPVVGATLSVKILGTAFRPQLYSVKTERDGVAVVSAQMPRFTTGRAAILIRAAAVDGRATETRRVIHAAKW